MIKAIPHPNYPAEAGRYVRGNDASPVALAIVLNTDEDKIPPDLERLVRVGVENGAALAGTVQTPNIGFARPGKSAHGKAKSQESRQAVILINLTEEDVERLKVIQMDHDAQDALEFIQERILPEIHRQQGSRMKGPLDGGTGSLR